jgi:hypothetical protein
MWRSIERVPRSSAYRLTAAVMAGVVFSAVASCAMEPEQKPVVELRLDRSPSPDDIPLSDEEKATIQKHPEIGELVQAWGNREFSVEYEGETIVFPAERAYAHIEQGRVVSVALYSPNLTGEELRHLMTTALRLWKASPEAVQKFEICWRDNRERIVEMNIGEADKVVSVGVCPSFNREKPHVFKCIPFWGFPNDATGSKPAAKE